MKDLDFDELDKAVNSLMSNVPKEQAPPVEEKTVTLPESSPTTSLLSAPTSPPAREVSSSPARSTAGSLAARRGGRFMDVVHPSADMKKTESTKPVSRQGVTIAPDSPVTPPDQTMAPTSSPEPVDEAPAPSEPPTSLHQPQATSDWPDPLDLMTKKEAAVEPEEANDPEGREDASPDTMTEASPLTSPFLPGAKVEKRPLGGATPDAGPDLPIQSLGKEDLTVNDPEAQLPPTPSEPEAPLPEELQGDLVAIESGSAKEAPEPALEPQPSTSKEEKGAPSTPDDTDAGYAKRPEPVSEPSGPTSIPKQYKEEPSTGDQQNGSIYDTDTYHQPLAHPAKKKSGWLIVLWIVLIVALGAATGAALFFFGII